MSLPRGLSPHGKAYVGAVVAFGAYVVGSSVYDLHVHPVPIQWFLLAALTLVSGSATVNLPSVPASISISETFVFTAVLLYGTAAGTVIVALDGLVISFWIARRRNEWHRAVFNTAAPAVSAWCSARLFFVLAGVAPLVVEPASLDRVLPALAVFAGAYFALNSWLITFAVVAETRLKPLTVWRQNFVWLSLNYFCGASVAFLLVTYTRNIDIRYVGVIVPLLLVLYFTFKTSMDRVKDANKHVEKVNQLYLSTIETLAMAIDAKDQVTHGHIRRVQTYAVGLARELGTNDDKLIKAIEAAALLHDMGKLAVPEYILNKPGKLTPAEFEKMKLHASVGADILSAIDFPYPVVPIVRHHHEFWDGRGYPDGLKGTDIPIGARILAVVDCFDALTSDRPYRPRLSDSEALQIVLERRGTMYDPLVVDTFVRTYKDLGPPSPALESEPETIEHFDPSRSDSATLTDPRLDDISASADEMLTMYELARALTGLSNLEEAGNVTANHLRRLIPFALCVVYLHESSTGDLEATFVSGEGASIVRGLRIPFGQRLSGWVAANRQTIVNSDPMLDLGEAARAFSPRLRSCLSTSLLAHGQLVGVISLYSSQRDAFTEDHRRILETVTGHITDAIKFAAETECSTRYDPVTGLPTERPLQELLSRLERNERAYASESFLLIIDVPNLGRINEQYGRRFGDEALRHVVDRVRAILRNPNTFFRCAGDSFVVVFEASDRSSVAAIATRIRQGLTTQPLTLRSSTTDIEVRTTVMDIPHKMVPLEELMASARNDMGSARSHDGPSVH